MGDRDDEDRNGSREEVRLAVTSPRKALSNPAARVTARHPGTRGVRKKK